MPLIALRYSTRRSLTRTRVKMMANAQVARPAQAPADSAAGAVSERDTMDEQINAVASEIDEDKDAELDLQAIRAPPLKPVQH